MCPIAAAGALRLTAVEAADAPMFPQWQRANDDEGPQDRYYGSMVYDSGRDVCVLFGGWNGAYLGDTWEWDGDIWTLRSSTGPHPRTLATMSYDADRGVTVLFGGFFTVDEPFHRTTFRDTWEWDGNTWTQRSDTGPTRRGGQFMTYDSARQKTVLFGGFDPLLATNYFKGDTWEWDGASWSQVFITGPTPRAWGGLAYDSQRQVSVLFGGFGSDDGNVFSPRIVLDQTWEWNGTTWTQRLVDPPPYRYQTVMAYDSVRGGCVIFGGKQTSDNDDFLLRDTWSFDGTAWHQESDTGPDARYGHFAAYDSHREVFLIFGGRSEDGRLGDTWEYAVDTDGDGVQNHRDNCPGIANPDQADLNANGVGDACDPDDDSDTVPDVVDNCPRAANSDQFDADGDSVGDLCDTCPDTDIRFQVDASGCPIFAPCDFDRDGDVDPSDFGTFQLCISGEGAIQSNPACAGARLDADNDVDRGGIL